MGVTWIRLCITEIVREQTITITDNVIYLHRNNVAVSAPVMEMRIAA